MAHKGLFCTCVHVGQATHRGEREYKAEMRSLHYIHVCVWLQVHIHLFCVCVSRARPDSAVTPSPFPLATFLASLHRYVGCQKVFILCTRVSYVYSHTLYCMLCIFSHASHLRSCKPTRLALAAAIVANARRLGTGSSACTICILYIGGIPRMQAVTAPAACMRGIQSSPTRGASAQEPLHAPSAYYTLVVFRACRPRVRSPHPRTACAE